MAGLRPVHVYTETLVATIVFNDEVVRDTTDSLPALFMFTPAALRGTAAGLQYVDYHFRVAGGFAGVARVEREIIKELPPGTTYNFHDYSAVAAKVDLTNRPEALALLVFGALALLGTVLTAVQLVARRLREGRDDAAVARALGARPSAVVLDALSVPLAAVVAGAVLAVAVALALSPLSVIGPVRAVLPEGVHLEPGIVLGGAGAIVLVAAGVGWALAHRWAPGARARRARAPRSRVAAWGRATGLPTPAAVGLTFALEPGRGRTSVPVRSALVGVVAAVALVAATLTFGGGFSTLISHPSLYGWNLDNALTGSNDVPPQAIPVISKSPLVAAWAGVSYGDAQIDGQEIPVLLIRSGSSWEPPLIAGHEVESSNQIVLGAATMAELHAHLGGTVRGGYGSKRDYPVYIPPRTYRVVGVATLPAMGRSDVLHPSMGVGGVLDPAIEPPAMVKAIGTKYTALNGPQLLAVRFKPGVTRAQRTALLRQAIAAGNRAFAAVPNGQASGDLIASLGVQYPAQIISYRSTEKTPLILSLVFAGRDRGGLRPHHGGVGPTPPPRPGAAQVARPAPAPVGGDGGRPGDRVGGHRPRRRRAGRGRRRAVALGPLRQLHLRGAARDRALGRARLARPGRPRPGQRRRLPVGAHRGALAGRRGSTRGVAPSGRAAPGLAWAATWCSPTARSARRWPAAASSSTRWARTASSPRRWTCTSTSLPGLPQPHRQR